MGTRTPAGAVSIRNSNGRLQLMFRINTVRQCISLGLPDTRANRQYAKLQAAQVEMDILGGTLDRTYAKYKPHQLEINTSTDLSPVTPITLLELWEQYTDYKRPQLSPSTIAVDFRKVLGHVSRCPYKQIDDAIKIRNYLNRSTTPGVTKKVLTQLSACCNWGVKSKLIPSNPFVGMAADIKISKGKTQIEFFTPTERELIINHFWTTHSHYAPLVEFLFRTGCRPSEAVALEWQHVSTDCTRISFEQSLVVGEHSTVLKQGLKTQPKRLFPCGDNLSKFLVNIRPINYQLNQLVFPSEFGLWINTGNFTTDHWKPAIAALGLKYRSPYKMRHTFITHGLESLDAKDLAELAGNSAAIIYSNYAGVLNDLKSPDF